MIVVGQRLLLALVLPVFDALPWYSVNSVPKFYIGPDRCLFILILNSIIVLLFVRKVLQCLSAQSKTAFEQPALDYNPESKVRSF
ncbi:hypothetical protein L6164_022755 [Bauhinia variegata]|uniref:Uncharacterized protein n=1 Tax=Bauhinia variegata TaxID=167791 RepID=A0ACB9MG72_BAUVA|nr:hypothetical protein L6164_022755 [Bauhinia variegata]